MVIILAATVGAVVMYIDYRFVGTICGEHACTRAAPFGGDLATGAVLSHNSGGGSHRPWKGRMRPWPLPPDGPLPFAWDDEGIEETLTSVDAAALVQAAQRAIKLWPDNRPAPPRDLRSCGSTGTVAYRLDEWRSALASPILRDTIKKLRDRKSQLQKEVKAPLEELRQIEEDLQALGASSSENGRGRHGGSGSTRATRRKVMSSRAPRGANQAAILRAIRDGATTPKEISEKTSIAGVTVNSSLTSYVNKQRLVTRGANGLALTKSGRDKLRELEAK